MDKTKVALLLTVIMLLAVPLAACGSSGQEEPSQPPQSSSEADRVSEAPFAPQPEEEEEEDQNETEDTEDAGDSAVQPSQVAAAEQITSTDEPSPAVDTPIGEYSAFDLRPETGVFYSLNGDYTCSLSDYEKVEQLAKTINDLNNGLNGGLNPGTPGPESDGGFLVVMQDYSKFIYNLKKPVLVINGMDYLISDQQYQTLKQMAANWGDETYIQWLVYMNPNRVTAIDYKSGDTTGTYCEEYIGEFADRLRFFMVNKGSGSTFTSALPAFAPGDDRYEIKLTFDNGIHYTLRRDGSTLYLTSSDMSFGCRYTLPDSTQADYILDMLLNPDDHFGTEANPATGKPVIYLYPEKTQDVSVTLDFKGRLSTTYPAYNGGWKVTAQPDGTLTNLSDGSTHYYLFWDGHPDKDEWDFSEGFVVKGSEVESFLLEKLPLLGLTPREYNDFITYWAPEMKQNAFNLVTFSTTEYEELAKLDVSPKPDSVVRVHMVFKAVPGPVAIKEQQLTTPERTGFTMVEWGGTRA